MTTHIVCNFCTLTESEKFKKFKDVDLVNVDFLIQSLKFKKRVLEEDFQIFPMKKIQRKSFLLGSNKKSIKWSKRTSESLEFSKRRKTTFSKSNIRKNNSQVISKSVSKLKLKSTLFEKTYFYFPPCVSGTKIYKVKAIENSGKIIQNLKNFNKKKKKIFVVFKDGDKKSKEGVINLKLKLKIQPISPRWIDWCLERNHVLSNPNKGEFIHLLPFNVKTPCKRLKGVKIYFENFDLEKISSLKETGKILGFEIVGNEEMADIVILPKKYFKILCYEKKNSGKFQHETWLLRILENGDIRLPEELNKKFL